MSNSGKLICVLKAVGWSVAASWSAGLAAQQPPDIVTSDSSFNTAMGTNAMLNQSGSSQNTAAGYEALMDVTGSNNTAFGVAALSTNTSGSSNTAVGSFALGFNVTGSDNTAMGVSALLNNSSGTGNTAVGQHSMYENTTGSYNTTIGVATNLGNSTGSYTTAVGAYALANNQSGGYDTGFGAYTLNYNTSGSGNTAFGYAALRSTSTGNNNIGFGYQALYQDANGSNNIAMGYQAAYNLYSGSNTIEIGSMGGPGDDNLIRIGNAQTATYVAGIAGSHVTGSAVYVTSSGQLGVLASSERYKTHIASLEDDSARLGQLRPVSFHLKSEPEGTVQYGLIAEEVAKVYPELVIHDGEGTIQGVRYEELAPLLLKQVQQQESTIRLLQAQVAELQRLTQSRANRPQPSPAGPPGDSR